MPFPQHTCVCVGHGLGAEVGTLGLVEASVGAPVGCKEDGVGWPVCVVGALVGKPDTVGCVVLEVGGVG